MPKSRTRTKKNRRRPGGHGDAQVVITLLEPGQEFVDTPCCGRLHVTDFAFLDDVTFLDFETSEDPGNDDPSDDDQ